MVLAKQPAVDTSSLYGSLGSTRGTILRSHGIRHLRESQRNLLRHLPWVTTAVPRLPADRVAKSIISNRFYVDAERRERRIPPARTRFKLGKRSCPLGKAA